MSKLSPILGLILVLLLAGQTRAQGDLDLLSGTFSSPNVMILFDFSRCGSPSAKASSACGMALGFKS